MSSFVKALGNGSFRRCGAELTVKEGEEEKKLQCVKLHGHPRGHEAITPGKVYQWIDFSE